jgi:hypothetical protein
MWETAPSRSIFTHCTPQGATRLHRIYIYICHAELEWPKDGVETVVSAFTDHLSVVLRLSLDIPLARRGRRFWKMNISLLEETVEAAVGAMATTEKALPRPNNVVGELRHKENSHSRHARRSRAQTGRNVYGKIYDECLYDVLQDTDQHRAKATALKELKAKLVRLNSARLQRVMTDTDTPLHYWGKGCPSSISSKCGRDGSQGWSSAYKTGMGHPNLNKGHHAHLRDIPTAEIRTHYSGWGKSPTWRRWDRGCCWQCETTP